MSIRFYWCHTAGCPNHGRARRRTPQDSKCEFCNQPMKLAAPGERFAIEEKGTE